MAVRDSWAVGSDTERLLDVEDARLAMGAVWAPTGAITARSGFTPTGGSDPGAVTASAPTPDGFVHTSPFQYVRQSNRGGGTYTWTLDATWDTDVLGTAPADPANPRHDLIVVQQSDAYFADADSQLRIRHVVGTPAATPTDPPVDGSSDYIRLARIVVPANADQITSSDIVDLRGTDRYTTTLGGVLPVPSQTARDIITDPYDGMAVYRTDRDWLEVFDGTAWRNPAMVSTTALADISNPSTGQIAFSRSTNLPYRYTGSAWVRMFPEVALQRTTAQPIPSGAVTPINWDAPDEDELDMWDSVTPSRVQIPTSGRYRCTFNGAFAFTSTSTLRVGQLRVNGSSSDILADTRYNAIANNHAPLHLDGEDTFVTGDYLEVVVYHEHGSDLDVALSVRPRLVVRRVSN
ncbi:hypothetical protein GCM10012275_54420 [Longimycelium tulufanense]|uniref:Uncharacterized protein n=1 Tax=Longimycelium tulufanense TaxID=907463 RepID=A0A8J3FX59_9PSEU|nr:hypothetical protein [Longimycelium tulufanense]GGM76870.1 hypothetical protein GCM10012275_54420 [Longimycelium tulufanense]